MFQSKFEHFDDISQRTFWQNQNCFLYQSQNCPFLRQSIYIYVDHSNMGQSQKTRGSHKLASLCFSWVQASLRFLRQELSIMESKIELRIICKELHIHHLYYVANHLDLQCLQICFIQKNEGQCCKSRFSDKKI